MDAEIRAILEEIRDGARDGRGWRDRTEMRMDGVEKTLTLLAHKSEEFSEIVKIHLENGRGRFDRIEARLLVAESAGRGGDVTVIGGTQSQGVAPETAVPVTSRKPGAAAGVAGGGFVGGIVGWLSSGGWDQLSALIKKITG